MQFLGSAGHFSGDDEAVVRESFGLPPITPGKHDGFYSFGLALLKRLTHVRRLARGSNAKEDLISLQLARRLPGKNLLKSVVVSNGGEYRAVGGQCFCRKRVAAPRQLANKFSSKVLGIPGGTAIASN